MRIATAAGLAVGAGALALGTTGLLGHTSFPFGPMPAPASTQTVEPHTVLKPGTLAGATYQNPVLNGNAADPSVLYSDNSYFLTHTGGSISSGGAFPIETSPDAVHWEAAGHVLTRENAPAWVKPDGKFWAPDFQHVGEKYEVVFTAENRQGQLQVGEATADHAAGPYTAQAQPLVKASDVGVIDPSIFHDARSGENYLLWKVDGNAECRTTPIEIQRMNAAADALVGEPKEILRPELARQGDLLEGPEMFTRPDGQYELMVAANRFGTPSYIEDTAKSPSPMGPFTFEPEPLASNGGGFVGVGHASNVFNAADGSPWLVAHAWEDGAVGPGNGHQRVLVMEPLTWDANGHPQLGPHGHPEAGKQTGPAQRGPVATPPTAPIKVARK